MKEYTKIQKNILILREAYEIWQKATGVRYNSGKHRKLFSSPYGAIISEYLIEIFLMLEIVSYDTLQFYLSHLKNSDITKVLSQHSPELIPILNQAKENVEKKLEERNEKQDEIKKYIQEDWSRSDIAKILRGE